MNGEPDLKALLAGEIERRLSLFAGNAASIQDIKAAMHSLKGSAAMAGESELALVVGQLAQRLNSGDPAARRQASKLLTAAQIRLAEGKPAFASSWPEPPPHLAAAVVDSEYRMEYSSAMRDRLDALSELLQGDAQEESAQRAYRIVHGMKGAAASMGDDVTTWFCHGLESRLKLDSDNPIERAWTELSSRFPALVRLIEEPENAVGFLRSSSQTRQRESSSSPEPATPSIVRKPTQRPSSAWPTPVDDSASGEQLRVPSATLDQFLEHAERIDLIREELFEFGASVARQSTSVRELRGAVLEALRVIGPPKPWGVPAAAVRNLHSVSKALGEIADTMQSSTQVGRTQLEHLHSSATEIRSRAATLQRTTVSWLFERVRLGIEQTAAAEGQLVRVDVQGGELSASRRIVERLHDPIMQLTRNALAHGIRSPERRAQTGKDPLGRIVLGASRIGDWLQITVEDDGEGVDLDRVRRLAVARGVLRPKAAGFATESDLLGLLFLPGMTTRTESDMLAGRGVGLDLTQDVVRRLGGTVRLSRRDGPGIVATIRVPAERGVVDVLWLKAGGHRFAIPVCFTGTVARCATPNEVPLLSTVVGLPQHAECPFQVNVQIPGVQGIGMAVEEVTGSARANIRPLPPTVAAAGPYTGATLRSDGSLHLVLDAAVVAAQLWTLSVPHV